MNPNKNRIVQIMHKLVTRETGKDGQSGPLAVGETLTFRSGDAYTVQPTGAVVRANPKSSLSKKERKLLRKRRQLLENHPYVCQLCALHLTATQAAVHRHGTIIPAIVKEDLATLPLTGSPTHPLT